MEAGGAEGRARCGVWREVLPGDKPRVGRGACGRFAKNEGRECYLPAFGVARARDGGTVAHVRRQGQQIGACAMGAWSSSPMPDVAFADARSGSAGGVIAAGSTAARCAASRAAGFSTPRKPAASHQSRGTPRSPRPATGVPRQTKSAARDGSPCRKVCPGSRRGRDRRRARLRGGDARRVGGRRP